MIRKQFFLSTATICLMLAFGPACAQSPADSKKDEATKERVQKNEPARPAGARSEGQGKSRDEHSKPATSAEKSGAGSPDEKGHEKDRAATDPAKQHDQSADPRHGSKASSDKPGSEKAAAGNKSDQDTRGPEGEASK